jgi:hypothetical protein
MSDRFAGVARGQPLRGARKIADYVLADPEASEIVSSPPRDEFGFIMIGRDLTGFTGWIDHALAERARTSKSRRPKRRASKESAAAAAA